MMYFLIIFTVVISRLLPHAPNFSCLTAIGIFSAMYLSPRKAIGITITSRLISDLFLGFFSWPLMLAVYLSHLFGIVMGLWIRKHKTIGRILIGPMVSAVVFFLVTNFAWLYPMYDHTWTGIMQSYVNGLPFFRGTLMGDMFYTIVLVGSFELFRVLQSQFLTQHGKKIF